MKINNQNALDSARPQTNPSEMSQNHPNFAFDRNGPYFELAQSYFGFECMGKKPAVQINYLSVHCLDICAKLYQNVKLA
jgi:hypothetical protein